MYYIISTQCTTIVLNLLGSSYLWKLPFEKPSDEENEAVGPPEGDHAVHALILRKEDLRQIPACSMLTVIFRTLNPTHDQHNLSAHSSLCVHSI